jgi:hypothetical protein
MKLRLAVLCNIGGCIILKFSAMIGNTRRVEGCIAKEFKYEEVTTFTSVYYADEHNIKVPTLRYHDDVGTCSNIHF